jgi:hypothetical protein
MISVAGRHAVALAALLLFCCPVMVKGQQSGSRDVSALIGGVYKATRFAGDTRSMVGVKAAVVFSGGVEIGGVGIKLVEPVDISVGAGGLVELRTGYGGVTFAKRGLLGSRLGAGFFLGAGHAEIRALPVGNQLGSDNFFVFEPEVTLEFLSWNVLRSALGAGFRFVTGVDDLPTLSAADLRGFTVTLIIVVGGP